MNNPEKSSSQSEDNEFWLCSVMCLGWAGKFVRATLRTNQALTTKATRNTFKSRE